MKTIGDFLLTLALIIAAGAAIHMSFEDDVFGWKYKTGHMKSVEFSGEFSGESVAGIVGVRKRDALKINGPEFMFVNLGKARLRMLVDNRYVGKKGQVGGLGTVTVQEKGKDPEFLFEDGVFVNKTVGDFHLTLAKCQSFFKKGQKAYWEIHPKRK